MSLEHEMLEKMRGLPLDRQQEALDFVEFLAQKPAGKRPRRSLMGLCADLGMDITSEDIAEARREMWGGFPRADIT
jgi:predicted signal transduction protein with EAL and GGDEF domain